MPGRPIAAAGDRLFATTRWSLVLDANGSHEAGRDALAELCTIYWQPLYLFLRRRNINGHDAQDLVQGFFADVLRKRSYLRADRDKGRFRTFMIGALIHYVAHTEERNRAQKRGGGAIRVPISEAELLKAEANAQTARGSVEQSYDREWAAALLARTLKRLEEECAISGKTSLFEGLKAHLIANGDANYKQLAEQLGRPVVTLRSHVGRFRSRYRAILREEVANTVAEPSDIDDELRYLRQIVAAG